jgi:hypothetical protein
VRLRHIYFRVALGGLLFLVFVTAILWAVGAHAAYGFLVLAEYWLMLGLAVALIVVLARAGRRLF